MHPPTILSGALPSLPARPVVAGARRAGALGRRLALALIVAVLGACAATAPGLGPVQQLREALAAGDLERADALIARYPRELDARRALDVAIRGGHVDAVRHYLPRAGPDADLDPDATTPLIRAVRDAPSPQRVELVGVLVASGAGPQRPDRYGRDAIEYAIVRDRIELLVLMDTDAANPLPPPPPAFAPWLAAEPFAAGSAPADAVRGLPVDGRRLLLGSPWRAGAPPAGAPPAALPSAKPEVTSKPTATAKPTASPRALRPSVPAPVPAATPERAGLRFHVDGTADVLRWRAADARPEPMVGFHAVWRIEGGRVEIAVVGDAFAALCVGMLEPAPPPAAASARRRATGSAAPAPRLRLACEEAPLARRPGERYGPEYARAVLSLAGGLASAESVVPLQATPVAWAMSGADAAPRAAPRRRVEPLAVALGPVSAQCTPSTRRPRTLAPAAGAATHEARGGRPPADFGDAWVFDARRYEAFAPLSGRMCPQPVALQAALAACRAGAPATACRPVGGCPAGQASALATLPGVNAAWLACGNDAATARRLALAACRADLGCDCQLVAVSGANVNTQPGGDACAVPVTRRR
jgi:hypothetical protein